MEKLLTNDELYKMNTIAVKLIKQNREYIPTIGNRMIIKEIDRTVYLKRCWMCGKPYESYKLNSFACSKRCSQNIIRHRKQGLNPIANMPELTKAKNVKEIKELFGYL
jgi:hypothetical protein